MKLKQIPHDFVVKELLSVPLSSEKKAHQVFVLQKQSVDTFDAIRLVSSRLKIPLFQIGYAGLKDKHALTRQYVSFPSHVHVQFQNTDTLSLQFIGYTDRKIHVGDLLGNRFQITVRDIKDEEIDKIFSQVDQVVEYGVPNYFDSQRFGSVIDNDFIAKHLIREEYEAAVRCYLTKYQKSEPKNVKDEKRRLASVWPHLTKINVRTRELKRVVETYLQTQDWLAAYKKIPAHLREMYVNAYQSFLWNECVKETLKTCVDKKRLFSVDYAVGSLLFYSTLDESEKKDLPISFPTLSESVKFTTFEQSIINEILQKQKITFDDFAIHEQTGSFFKSRERLMVLKPKDFMISDPSEDELNHPLGTKRKKITLTFSIPKGSYATVITKRFFRH